MGAATVIVEESLTFDSSISPISCKTDKYTQSILVIILFLPVLIPATCKSALGAGDNAHIDIVAARQLHLRHLTGRRQGICTAKGGCHDGGDGALQLGRSFVEGECATDLE